MPNAAPTDDDLSDQLFTLPGLLTRNDVLRLFSISRHTLTYWMERRDFPQPLKLSAATWRWQKRAVRDWLQRTAARDKEDGER
jgi:predicted DNA-binding transcriptional regulator AlpA